jgi:hypothetical protein
MRTCRPHLSIISLFSVSLFEPVCAVFAFDYTAVDGGDALGIDALGVDKGDVAAGQMLFVLPLAPRQHWYRGVVARRAQNAAVASGSTASAAAAAGAAAAATASPASSSKQSGGGGGGGLQVLAAAVSRLLTNARCLKLVFAFKDVLKALMHTFSWGRVPVYPLANVVDPSIAGWLLDPVSTLVRYIKGRRLFASMTRTCPRMSCNISPAHNMRIIRTHVDRRI